jgi:hypothetical protein
VLRPDAEPDGVETADRVLLLELEGVRVPDGLWVPVVVTDAVCDLVAVPLRVVDAVSVPLGVPVMLCVLVPEGLNVGVRVPEDDAVPDTLRVPVELGVLDQLGVWLVVWDRDGAHVCAIDERLSAR